MVDHPELARLTLVSATTPALVPRRVLGLWLGLRFSGPAGRVKMRLILGAPQRGQRKSCGSRASGWAPELKPAFEGVGKGVCQLSETRRALRPGACIAINRVWQHATYRQPHRPLRLRASCPE